MAEITAEQVLGEYWKDPLFGEAASEKTVVVEVLSGRFWPREVNVPVSKNIRFVFRNKSKQAHLIAVAEDIKVLLADERFKKFVEDELYHSQQQVVSGRGHSHTGSSVDDAESLVKTLSQWPTVFIKPGDEKEILIRFDKTELVSFYCVLDQHQISGYHGLIEIN